MALKWARKYGKMQEDKYEIDFLFTVILCAKNITNEIMPLFFNPHVLVSEPRLIVGKINQRSKGQ